MLLLMIERGMPIDIVLTADTGMEFPEMYDHLAKLDEYLYRERGIHLTMLRHPKGFEYMMFEEEKQKISSIENRQKLGVPLYGNGWPGVKVRWCTGQLKTHLISKEVNRLKGEYQALHYEVSADTPTGVLTPAHTVPQEVVDLILCTAGNEPNSAERVAVFYIYNARTNRLVETIKADKNGLAVSKPLPLGRYKIVESKAGKFYGLDKTPIEVEIEFAGQIVKVSMTNKCLYTNVSIKKTGPSQAVPGQPIRYVFSQIKNGSNVSLDSFYWRDQIPAQITLNKLVTGSYNQQQNYKVVYKTNLSEDYRTLADNLSTSKVYVLDARPAVLGLAANERVTEIMFVFGNVRAGFAQVETPYIYATARSGLANNSSIVNVADVGGLYDGQWIQAVSRWLTTVYAKTTVRLPKTGY